MSWLRPIRSGWVIRDEVPGPDVDEFAEPDRVVEALAGAMGRTLLAVQHPHRTPEALAAGLGLAEALPIARSTLAVLLRTAYRRVENVVAPYRVDGRDGSVTGVLCMVGLDRVRHAEAVYPEVVADRAEVLAGLGCLTSAAMLVPVRHGERLTAAVLDATAHREPVVSTVDSVGRRHRVWLVAPDLLAGVGEGPLMVADGNHRVAAAAAAGLSELLALVAAGPDLRVGAFHRALTGTGLDAGRLADAWLRVGLVVREVSDQADPAPGRVVVRCPGGTLAVDLPVTGDIDHSIVENLLLDKALGVDPAGPHVHALPGDRPLPAGADVVILIAAVPLKELLARHAAGQLMPRKSTYFTPKPRSGLVLADVR
jgi:Protein of unknown function (DUF1015)